MIELNVHGSETNKFHIPKYCNMAMPKWIIESIWRVRSWNDSMLSMPTCVRTQRASSVTLNRCSSPRTYFPPHCSCIFVVQSVSAYVSVSGTVCICICCCTFENIQRPLELFTLRKTVCRITLVISIHSDWKWSACTRNCRLNVAATWPDSAKGWTNKTFRIARVFYLLFKKTKQTPKLKFEIEYLQQFFVPIFG